MTLNVGAKTLSMALINSEDWSSAPGLDLDFIVF